MTTDRQGEDRLVCRRWHGVIDMAKISFPIDLIIKHKLSTRSSALVQTQEVRHSDFPKSSESRMRTHLCLWILFHELFVDHTGGEVRGRIVVTQEFEEVSLGILLIVHESLTIRRAHQIFPEHPSTFPHLHPPSIPPTQPDWKAHIREINVPTSQTLSCSPCSNTSSIW